MEKANLRFLTGIFFVSSATLCLEISLTRYFSVSQQYHFAFLVVSIAFLGYGASGSFLAAFKKILGFDRGIFLSLTSLVFSLFIFLGFFASNSLPFDFARLSWDRSQIFFIPLFYFFLSLPFLFAGLTISFAISRSPDLVNKIYFFDLLGAGTGTLMALFIFLPKGDRGTIPLICLLPLVSAFLFSPKHSRLLRGFLALLMACEALLFILSPSFLSFRISPYKALPTALKYPGAKKIYTGWDALSRVDILDSPAVRFAPGLSLIYAKSLPPQLGLSVDGGELTAVTSFKGLSDPSLDFLNALPSSAAFSFFEKPRVLVIEPRGALDVLSACIHEASRIKVIEDIPLAVKILREELAEFSGGLYAKQEILVETLHSRAALKREKDTFDLVILSLSDAFGSAGTGLFGFGEKYLYTIESFTDILNRLSPQGTAVMSLYLLPPPRQELRSLATWVAALERAGKDPSQHLIAIRSWGTVTYFIRKSAVSEADIQKIKGHCQEFLFDLVYYPGIKEEEVNLYNRFQKPLYYDFALQILSPSRRKEFFKDYLFDVTPVSDNKPFFFNFFKLGKIKTIYGELGQKWLPFLQGEYLVPLLLLQACLASLVLIILPLLALKRRSRGPGLVPVFFYFSLIGMAFIFIEIILIQKFILFLGHPLYSVSITIFSLLLSAGLGSYFSKKLLGVRIEKRLRFGFGLLAILVIAALFLLPQLDKHFIGYSLPAKFLLAFLFIFPLGFLMGFPFPAGIRLLERKQKDLIPWAWATNAFSTVTNSVMAMLVAFIGGYNLVLALAAAGYLLALPFLGFTRHRHKPDA